LSPPPPPSAVTQSSTIKQSPPPTSITIQMPSVVSNRPRQTYSRRPPPKSASIIPIPQPSSVATLVEPLTSSATIPEITSDPVLEVPSLLPLPEKQSSSEQSSISKQISASELVEIVTETVPIIDEPLPSTISETITTNTPPASLPEPVDNSPPTAEFINMQFKINGRKFHVIDKYENSLVAAGYICRQQDQRSSVATITSDSYQAVAENLKDIMVQHGGSNKVIIGSWNGDNYSLAGNSCLILHVDHGIFPGTCADASAILCQS
jgi:hypothetical protein